MYLYKVSLGVDLGQDDLYFGHEKEFGSKKLSRKVLKIVHKLNRNKIKKSKFHKKFIKLLCDKYGFTEVKAQASIFVNSTSTRMSKEDFAKKY